MSDVKWIKITVDIFDDEKMKLIDALPEADAIIVIWFKLLTLAGKTNNDGIFLLNDKLPYTDEMLATLFRRPLNTVRLALSTFESFGMIETQGEIITIPKWEKHQNIDGLEKIREQTRNRVAKHREKQKLLTDGENKRLNSNNNDDVTLPVTQRNAIDKNREEKKRKEKKRKDIYIGLPDELTIALSGFEEMRKKIGAPLTDRALGMNLKKAKELAGDDLEKTIAILDQSTMRSWKGVFPLTEENKKTNKSFTEIAKEMSERGELKKYES